MDAQNNVSAICRETARTHDLILVPVGDAMHFVATHHPEVFLYASETNAHQNKKGSYLVACTLYVALTGKPLDGLPLRFDAFPDIKLSSEEANVIHDAIRRALNGTALQETIESN